MVAFSRDNLPPIEVRQIAASASGSVIAAGEYTRFVHLFKPDAGLRLPTLDTPLDFGGKRLVVTSDERHCLATSYKGDLRLYNTGDGSVAWVRKDLRQLQVLQLSKCEQFVFCGFDKKPGHVLDRNSGRTIRLLRETRQIFESRLQSCVLLDRNSDCALVEPSGSEEVFPKGVAIQKGDLSTC